MLTRPLTSDTRPQWISGVPVVGDKLSGVKLPVVELTKFNISFGY